MNIKMLRKVSTVVIAFTFLTGVAAGVRGTFANATRAYNVPEVEITVTEDGFSPRNVILRRGVRSRITFLRQVDNTCATEIVVQELGINVSLPLNASVSVEVTPKSPGQYDYGCGTGAYHGTIMVR